MKHRRTQLEFRELVTVEAYVALTAAPFIYSAARGRLDTTRGVVATVLVAIVVLALVRRRRGAWLLLILLDSFVLVSYTWEWAGALPFAVNAAAFALLISAPMGRYVGHEGRQRRIGVPPTP